MLMVSWFLYLTDYIYNVYLYINAYTYKHMQLHLQKELNHQFLQGKTHRQIKHVPLTGTPRGGHFLGRLYPYICFVSRTDPRKKIRVDLNLSTRKNLAPQYQPFIARSFPIFQIFPFNHWVSNNGVLLTIQCFSIICSIRS